MTFYQQAIFRNESDTICLSDKQKLSALRRVHGPQSATSLNLLRHLLQSVGFSSSISQCDLSTKANAE